MKRRRNLTKTFIPLKAQDTGLVPKHWSVMVDEVEKEINPTKINFLRPVKEDEAYINGHAMLQRACEAKAIGSLGFAKWVLNLQKRGKVIIPSELRGKTYIVCPRTVLCNTTGDRLVAGLFLNVRRWTLRFISIDRQYFKDFHLPCSCE